MKILFTDIYSDSGDIVQKLTEDHIFSINYIREEDKASEHIQLYEYDCILFHYQKPDDKNILL